MFLAALVSSDLCTWSWLNWSVSQHIWKRLTFIPFESEINLLCTFISRSWTVLMNSLKMSPQKKVCFMSRERQRGASEGAGTGTCVCCCLHSLSWRCDSLFFFIRLPGGGAVRKITSDCGSRAEVEECSDYDLWWRVNYAWISWTNSETADQEGCFCSSLFNLSYFYEIPFFICLGENIEHPPHPLLFSPPRVCFPPWCFTSEGSIPFKICQQCAQDNMNCWVHSWAPRGSDSKHSAASVWMKRRVQCWAPLFPGAVLFQ